MIALSIASLEKITEKEKAEMDFFWRDKYNEYDAYSYPIFISRRIGFCIIKYFGEYYKIDHHLVPQGIDEGEEVLTICRDCFAQTMYDTKQNTFYCPRCES